MPLHLECPSCGGTNRVAADKLDRGPTCGRCKSKLGWPAAPIEVDDATLDELVRSAPVPVLVDFWAAWCAPCRAVAPHLATLANRQKGKLIVVKVDTDKHQQTMLKLHIQAIPTLVIYKDGALVDRQSGALMGPQLERFVTRHL